MQDESNRSNKDYTLGELPTLALLISSAGLVFRRWHGHLITFILIQQSLIQVPGRSHFMLKNSNSERNGLNAVMKSFDVQLPVPDFQLHMKKSTSYGEKHDEKGRTVLGNALCVNEKAVKNESCL